MTALLLGYRDIQAARQFFVEALGFEEGRVLDGNPGEDAGAAARYRVTRVRPHR